MADRMRNKLVQFWVTEKEYEIIKDKSCYCDLTLNEYMRQMGVDGVIIKRDFSKIDEVNKIGTNINQIAKLANSRGSLIERDVVELRLQYEQLFEVMYREILNG